MGIEQQARDAYSRWLDDTHAPALRKMDSEGAFMAAWQTAQAAERARLASKAQERAAYEATAAAHHAGRWQEAMDSHTTRHAAMRDLIRDVFGS